MPKTELTLLTQYRLKTMYYVKGAYSTCQASPKKDWTSLLSSACCFSILIWKGPRFNAQHINWHCLSDCDGMENE